MSKVMISQSNYIPWKGYFDLIASVDEFIVYDDMQYTRRDWRNRNQIKTPNGVQWLTVPVQVKGKYHQKVLETQIDGTDWSSDHWKSLLQNYRKAPHFEEISQLLRPYYGEMKFEYLTELNVALITLICGYLGIKTRITGSWEYKLVDGKSERLLDLCQKVGGTEYLSGPAAKEYLDESLFNKAGVRVTWFDYSGYPEYPQLYDGFRHDVSVIDLMFNCGSNSTQYMKMRELRKST